MAVRFCLGDSCQCHLAQPEKLASASKLLVGRLFIDRVPRGFAPFTGFFSSLFRAFLRLL